MYLDSGGADENGVVTTLDQKLAAKEDPLLRGTIDAVRGIQINIEDGLRNGELRARTLVTMSRPRY